MKARSGHARGVVHLGLSYFETRGLKSAEIDRTKGKSAEEQAKIFDFYLDLELSNSFLLEVRT